jgi:hypothetical protein
MEGVFSKRIQLMDVLPKSFDTGLLFKGSLGLWIHRQQFNPAGTTIKSAFPRVPQSVKQPLNKRHRGR